MKKLAVLAAAAGLSLAACAKHDTGDVDATANADASAGNGDFASDGVLINGGDLAVNALIPADEANGTTNDATSVGNRSGVGQQIRRRGRATAPQRRKRVRRVACGRATDDRPVTKSAEHAGTRRAR